MIIKYTNESQEIKHLSKADHKMKKLMDAIGSYQITLSDDYFSKLISSIVGQQLSKKAAQTIWDRVKALIGEITPQNIFNIEDTLLRTAGVSSAKISYLKGLSAKILRNEINLNSLRSKTDNEIVEILTSIKGIGRWTAEMFLIFSLGHKDVISYNDAGLKRTIVWLHSLDNTPSTDEIAEISSKWMPYRSVASLYLWEAIDRDLIFKPVSDL